MKAPGGPEGQTALSDRGFKSGVSHAMSWPCHPLALWLDFHVAPSYITHTYLFCAGSSSGFSPVP